jgi:hypothetical protein
MSKHTPGPWHIDPIKAHANGNRRIMAEQCTPVAVVPEHLAADARLIAAAPDLLEALKAMLNHTADLDPMQGYPPEEDFSAVKQARAAIDKAEAK